MKTKATSVFLETRYNQVFNRDENVVSVGFQFEDGVYYQTFRLPKSIKITEEQMKNGTTFFLNHIINSNK